MNMTLYHRVGGQPTVQAAVNVFYDIFMSKSEIAPFFKGITVQNQIKIMERFLTIVLKGNTEYDREAMRRAHAPLVKEGLNDHHLDVFNQTMTAALTQLDVPVELIEEFNEISESYRDDILSR